MPGLNGAAVAFFGAAVLGAPIPGQSQEIPIPTEWDTYYVWFLVANPDYQRQPREYEDSLTAAHIQYQLRLQADGRAIAAGGLAPLEGGPVVGITISRAASR